MVTALLESKLQIPRGPRAAVARLRLSDMLEKRIGDYRVVLVSAPAGYGKTTLLSEWARASSLPVAWLSLTGEEQQVERFLRYLLAAWEKVQPDVRETRFGMLLESRMPEIDSVLAAFVNTANRVSDDLVFVLDDYHVVGEKAIHEALSFILDHLPEQVHFVLTSRIEPPLPMARYRAHGQLWEIGTEELSFTREEASKFLKKSMGLGLDQDNITDLHEKTEGWIAGLQLSALALRGKGVTKDAPLVSGRQRFIADYLAEDVLERLPEEVQDFLLKTSLLDRLCGSLCSAVTGQVGADELLERLERENLFILSLDDEREWFRYHSLFAEFLHEALERRHPDEVMDLHRKAAGWYLQHDLPEPAISHALAGEDANRVIEIFDNYLVAKLAAGEIKLVAGWLESLPAAWYAAHPILGLAQAAFLFFTGSFEAAAHRVDEVEQQLHSIKVEDKRGQIAMVNAFRCFVACVQNDLQQAEAYADQALQDLPQEDLGFRRGIYGALGDTYRQYGHWEAAKKNYLQALEFVHTPAVRVQSAHVFGALADLNLRQGRLQKAAEYWRQALAAIGEPENWGALPLPVIGWIYIRMGEILYEWNQLDQAWDQVEPGLERAELGGDVRAMIAGYLISSRIKLSEDETEAASEYLERARQLVEGAQFAEWSSRFERLQIEVWLAQDRLRAAVEWSDDALRGDERDSRPESVVAHLTIARVLIIKGDLPSIKQAKIMLDDLIQVATEEGRAGIVIEALALQALAYWRQGEQADALTALERALRLAEPESYIRVFVDLGLPMGRLLQEAHSRSVMPDYVDRLLGALGAGMTELEKAETALPESLTPREREVLELIAAGLTNREVAEQLVVSPETVKKHSGNIYGKLGVSNRTEAVARARELGMLD
jgi:LuxR family maltose regulon positive regulatory protein